VIGEEGERHDSRIIDENVDGRVGLDGQGGEPGGVHSIGHVGASMDRFSSGGPDCNRDRFSPFGVDVGGNDACPPGADLLGHQPTEPARGARDDDDFPPDMIAHRADRTSDGGAEPVTNIVLSSPIAPRVRALPTKFRVPRIPAASLSSGGP
jgi:hypothetical protein